MTQADAPRFSGEGEGAGTDEVLIPGTGTTGADVPVDEADGGDEVLEVELVDDVPEDQVDEADTVVDATEAGPLVVALAERDEYLDSLRRLQAEFENYKKRVSKQQADQMSRAASSLVDKLLPVLDALDLATDHVGDNDSEEARALVAASGLLQGILAKEGLERIDPVGQQFDPNAHEAVGQVAAPEDADPTATGEPVVAQVMRAGYRWHGTVVRPAMVMVEG
jgi:molecular chaperone GrpE